MSATSIRLGVVGTGYVGLTTGACFAHLGHHVVCGDIDERKIESLRRGRIPIVEEGLEAIVREASDAGRLEFAVGSQAAARDADVVFLCVPTVTSAKYSLPKLAGRSDRTTE
jgi:UDPglucose 6-dehydrogenase